MYKKDTTVFYKIQNFLKLTMYNKFKQAVYQKLIPLIRIWKYLSLQYYLNTNDSINLIVVACQFKFKGWFSTDIVTLDVTNENHFKKYFKEKK